MPDTGGANDDAADDAARFGLPADLCTALSQRLVSDTAVWRQNVGAVMAFLAVSSQWRHASGPGGAMPTGFDYGGVRAGLDAKGTTITPDLWSDLQVMEFAALAAMRGDRG
ncbi:MAG: DUF1799 domain-containing protein [Glycocaulis sp.]